jgi:hypothetical protein
MNELRWLAGIGLVSLCACSDDPPADDGGQVCPDALANQVTAAEDAVAEFDTYLADRLSVAVPACVAIIEALGGNPPPTSQVPTVDEIEAACQGARQEIQSELAAGGGFEITVTATPCTQNAEAQAACEMACGLGDACDAICPARAAYETSCPNPSVVVMAAEPIKGSLEANLPTVAVLSFESDAIVASTTTFLGALNPLITDLDADPLCAGARDATETTQSEGVSAQTSHARSATAARNLVQTLQM